ncbi:MAG: hypothetical protein GWP08_13145 [Nitrospiraceae bacterium]|nr:hypothetical protein [Nitrospiraceae bacterium]
MLVAMMAVAFAAGGPGVLWFNACEIPPAGVGVDDGGEYTVWLWAFDKEAATATVGGQQFDVAAREKAKDEYTWRKAGKVTLKAGTVSVALGDTVAAVVFSRVKGFRPDAAMNHMRVFSQPERVHDRRAETAKHTNTVFTMAEFRSREEWEAFAARLRQRILLSSGLCPLPARTPLNAVITGRVVHDDYTVEKVRFEARPGFYVTGNLYRPVGDGPFPGIVSPHGHWARGRIEDGERGSVPGRCITLARMGAVVFSYDMVGYNDSLQFEHNWGDKREKLWGIHPFATQLWSSIRAVDFVQGLPDVDPERIGCTGASGGGTQTFALMAVDDRIKVAAPVNMISCSMQGGCLCENAPILRLANSNMEIGAMMAPRPLLMVSATGDWTRETPHVEYPAIRSIYRLYGVEDRVANVHVDAGHNYNKDSREAMYRFFGKWLLGDAEQWAGFTEPDFTVETDEALRVFPDGKLPEGDAQGDAVIAANIESNRAKWQAMLPGSVDEAVKFEEEWGDVLGLVLGAERPDVNDLAPERVGFDERSEYVQERWVLGRAAAGDRIPAILYRAADPTPQDAVLVVHGDGKAQLADVEHGGPGPLVSGLIAQGKAVLVIDAFLIGEHHAPGAVTKRVREGRFMDTFQPTDTGYRVQDVLTALAYLRSRRDMTGTIDVIGLGDGGVWCLLAGAIDGGVRKTLVDANGFDADDDAAWVARHYTPCIRSVGDIDTAAALLAPKGLAIWNAPESFIDGIRDRYAAIAPGALHIEPDPPTAAALLAAVQGIS